MLLPPAAAPAAPAASAPLRVWSVSKVDQRAGTAKVAGGEQVAGTLRRVVDLGRSAFNFGPTTIDPDPQYSSPVDGRASGDVFSSADGSRYSVAAQSPVLDHARTLSPKGGVTHLDEFQAFEKGADDASLRITITDALVEAIDDSLGKNSECLKPTRCFPVRSTVRFRARAFTAGPEGEFFNVGGVAFVYGHFGAWEQRVATFADSRRSLWTDDDFTSITFCADMLCSNRDAGALTNLNDPRTLRVPLRSIGNGELFGVHVSLDAETVDDRGVESAALAYLRDPQDHGPALLRTRGLKRRGAPRFKEPRAKPLAPARCPGKRPRQAGALQLSAPVFTADESERAPMVLVARTGGARGQASVSLRARGGSALARRDFKATTTTVRFAAGDRTPRLVEIPLREDTEAEPAETFSVALGRARCAKLGKQRNATVTILDDDQPPPPPPPPVFTIGGTVDGLQGSGLVLSNLGAEQPVSANGGFTLPGTHTTGEPYDVSVKAQPHNPDQRCTVQDGAGHVGSANVTNIAVRCTTTATPGGLDTTFGGGRGRVTVPGDGDGRAVLVQPDGHIVTVGPRQVGLNFHFDFGATRHDAAGNLDPGFGTGGIATTDLGGNDDKANDAALLPDGGFVAVGQADPAGLANVDFGLVRYTPNGRPEASFDGDGVATTDIAGRSNAANAVAVQPDGKIVLAGSALPNNAVDSDFALARYNPDGTLDTTFDGDGIATVDLGTQQDAAVAVAIQPDGKIVAAGNTSNGVGVARLLPNGKLDSTFDSIGITVDDLAMEAHGAALTPAGNILVAGFGLGRNATSDVKVASFGPNGKLNLGFGQLGVAATDIGGGSDFGDDLVVDASGKIVVVGNTSSPTVSDMALIRYTPGGTLDTSFDGDGFLTADISGFGDFGHDLTIDAQGRIVAAGSAGGFALMRVNP